MLEIKPLQACAMHRLFYLPTHHLLSVIFFCISISLSLTQEIYVRRSKSKKISLSVNFEASSLKC